jgi:hypothetical protein
MYNNKQSSVEQLMRELWDTPKDKFTWHTIMKYYSERHKQEIIESYREGRTDQQAKKPSRFYNRTSEQYYNETFE